MTKPKPKAKAKIGCYLRVSTASRKRDKKDEFRQTTKSQKHAIRQWAESAHVPESELTWYEDRLSGKTMSRKALNRLLKAVDAGKIDCVVVYKLDRFARNLQEGLTVLRELAQKVRVVSVSENIDFSNSTGMLIASILLSVAQWQRETIVERIKDGIAARREEGKTVGRPRDEAKLREIRKLFDGGTPVAQIAKQMQCTRQNVYLALAKTKKDRAA